MRLSEKQRQFVEARHELDKWMYSTGRYRQRRGDSYRDPRVFGLLGTFKGYGHKSSCHKLRLADDIILDVLNEDGDWEWATETEQYREVGEKWESLHPLAVWGGRFNDGNHFSFEHQGHR